MQFSEWLPTQIGPCKWMVGRNSKRRRKEGYDCFFTQERFIALQLAREKEVAYMNGSTPHLTEPDADLAEKRRRTKPGMAFWAGTGPAGKTCRGCKNWHSDGYLVASLLLKDSICDKFKSMMNGEAGPALPHYTISCKYFEPAEKERPISKPNRQIEAVGDR